MAHALSLAEKAAGLGEVPVGAVLVKNDQLVGEGWNQPIVSHDPTAHAEVMAIRDAGQTLNNYRLTGCDLFVTLEPCSMCAGAIIHARIRRLVIGADDPKTGAAGSVFEGLTSPLHNHQVEVTRGIGSESARTLLRDFFRDRR